MRRTYKILLVILFIFSANFISVDAMQTVPKEKPAYIEFINKNYGPRLARRAGLFKTPAWNSFKHVWQKLAAYPPASNKFNNLDRNTFLFAYVGAIPQTDASNLRAELKSACQELSRVSLADGSISSFEVNSLKNICQDQLSLMTYGPPSLTCRMITSGLDTEQELSTVNLIKKLNRLAALKTEGTIDANECQQAMDNLLSEVKLFMLIQTIKNNFYFLPYNGEPATIAEEILNKLNTLQDLKPESAARQKNTQQAIKQLNQLLPELNTLIISLES